MQITNQRQAAKQALLAALAKSEGNTQDSTVITAISNLSAIAPKLELLEDTSSIEGNWLLINAPNFPGRQADAQSRSIYTLGRLAFNMFEPAGLLVEIERVTQPVWSTGREHQFTHDIVVEFRTIASEIPELKGVVKNLAVCTPKAADSLQVEFTGGELMPLATNNAEKMQQWFAVFGEASPQFSLSLRERLMSTIVKWMFGISEVSQIDTQQGSRSFTMRKSPKGKLAILYLDENLRITKGEKGTILVCQRQP